MGGSIPIPVPDLRWGLTETPPRICSSPESSVRPSVLRRPICLPRESRPGQHSTPRDQPAARDPANHQSGCCANPRRTRRRRCVRCCLRFGFRIANTQLNLSQHRHNAPRRCPRCRPRRCPRCQPPKRSPARLRGGQAMALCTGPFTVNFAVQMQFKTHCEPDTTVAPLLCVAYELVRRARGWRRHTAYHAHTPMPPAPNMGPEVLARPN